MNKCHEFLRRFKICCCAIFALQYPESSEIEPEFESRTTTQKVTALSKTMFNRKTNVLNKNVSHSSWFGCHRHRRSPSPKIPKIVMTLSHSHNGNWTDHEFSTFSWIFILKKKREENHQDLPHFIFAFLMLN